MSNDNQQQPGRLEDQLRQMILANAPMQSTAGDPIQHAQPTVRLPPSGSYPTPEGFGHRPAPQQQFPHQHWNGRITSSPQGGFDPGLDSVALPPNQRRPFNMQPHAQYGPPQGYQQAHHGFNNRNYPPFGSPGLQQRARQQQQMQLDPNTFHRGNFGRPQMGNGSRQQHLFNPNQSRAPIMNTYADQNARQEQYLEKVATTEFGKVEMGPTEHNEKEAFRLALEQISHEVCEDDAERLPKISLEPFGSFKSGFATAGSDMDLVIVVKNNSSTSACFSLLEYNLPRALERRLLQLGYGARLLTRTRVPIIKVCETPGPSFLDKLREEREKWDDLPNEKKYPHLHQEVDSDGDGAEQAVEAPKLEKNAEVRENPTAPQKGQSNGIEMNGESGVLNGSHQESKRSDAETSQPANGEHGGRPQLRREDSKPWTRERKAGPLDFPKTGVGIQSDINFFNPLGIHNTQLLRCYSLCDSRVRPMVLFVKAWAKKRKINSSYSGTLSSYGYVLMVLHYLVNVANPPVLPNLQAPWTPFGNLLPSGEVVDGCEVRFWSNEDGITAAAQRGQLTNNREALGSLLSGFFQYYSALGGGVTFRWMQEVLSLRSQEGLLSKEEKGWVKAVTEEVDGKKIQHRFLFCIEDPFELNHNVARTVTHKGIVAIRDEFRRAKRILLAVGNGLFPKEGELFADLIEAEDFENAAVGPSANGMQNGAVDGPYDGDQAKSPTTPNDHMVPQAQKINQTSHTTNQQNPTKTRGNRKSPATGLQQHMKALDVTDNEAFPTLSGATKSTKKKSSPPHARNFSEDFSEISGDKAKAHLEDVRRRKHEDQAESTATGAAEAVLGDSD